MPIFDELNISDIAFQLVDAIEQSIQSRHGTDKCFVTTSDYKLAVQVITELVLRVVSNGDNDKSQIS